MQRLPSTSPEKPGGGLHPCAGRPSTIGPPQSVALFCLVARARHAGPHSANWRTPPQSVAFFCLEPQLATACEMPRAPSFPWLVLRPITSKACCAVPDFSSGQTRRGAAVRAQGFSHRLSTVASPFCRVAILIRSGIAACAVLVTQ